jgi:ABC-type uncharacterized transport system involved in gliding motility auxiliary subunit
LALLKLTRDKPRVVGFLTGHGERKPLGEANADLGRFVQGLSDEGIRSIELNLNEQATIPSNIDLLVIASPQILFSENEVTRITQWIDEGGAVLGLTDPNSVSWLEPLKNTLGVFQLAGTLVDATGQGLGVGDPSFVAITRYPEHELLKGFSLTTLFPQSVAWAKIENNAFHAQSLLRSGERSWTETGNIKNDIAFSAAEAEIPGPHDLALALTRLSPRPDRAEQRIVLLGDGDFLSNTYLGNAGNRALGVRIINWLVADDALIDLTPAQAPDRILKLTRTKLAVIGFGFLFALPLLMVVIGFWIVWRRKRR